MKPFVSTESGFTSTAGTLVPSATTDGDFSKWGTPERQKINAALAGANTYLYRRMGVQ